MKTAFIRPSSRSRRSAVRARKSLSAMNPRAGLADSVELTSKVIQTIKRHRKQRHAKLREMVREDEGVIKDTWASGRGGEILCPVCSQTVRGDLDVLEAHVDACLAYEGRRIQEQERDGEEDIWEDSETTGEVRLSVTAGATLRGE